MNPEEQIAALKHTVKTREDQLRRIMDELEEWKKLAKSLQQQTEALKCERNGWCNAARALNEGYRVLLDRITKDRTDRINQLPPEYARGIAKEP